MEWVSSNLFPDGINVILSRALCYGRVIKWDSQPGMDPGNYPNESLSYKPKLVQLRDNITQ